jgi:BMFP domain-containing protein YqiC
VESDLQRHRASRQPRALEKKSAQALGELIETLGLNIYKFPPFDTWEELQSARDESGLARDEPYSEEISDRLAISLSCLSVLHTLLSICATTTFTRLTRDDRFREPKNQASFSILSGMAADVGAVEVLTRSGFDIQAKVIVRALREKLDALIAVHLDRSFAVQFLEADSSDKANKFWHQRVARGKLLRNISKRLSHYSEDGHSPLDKSWLKKRNEFDRWLGEAVHPSHTTGILSAFPTFGVKNVDGTDLVKTSGQPSDLSVPTIRSVMAMSYEIMFLAQARHLTPNFDDADYINNITRKEDLDIGLMTKATSQFITNCIGNSWFQPNLEMIKLRMYAEGYMMAPLAGDVDSEGYNVEIIDALLKVLRAAKNRLEEKIASFEN